MADSQAPSTRVTSYPTTDGGRYESVTTWDPKTGDITNHSEHRLPDNRVITIDSKSSNGKSTRSEVIKDSDGTEIGRTDTHPDGTETSRGDTSDLGQDPERAGNGSKPNNAPSESSPEEKPAEETPPEEGDEPTKEDPEASGKCTDCETVEPSIWDDLGTFAIGFLKGAAMTVGAIAVTAVIGLVSIEAAAFFAVGLAVVGAVSIAWELGTLIGKGIAGILTREEALDTAGIITGGVAVGGIAGVIRGKSPVEPAFETPIETQPKPQNPRTPPKESPAEKPSYSGLRKRFEELSKDPDHPGKITDKSRREARYGLELEKNGVVDAPIKRPDGPERGDFIDGKNNKIDVKFTDPRSSEGLDRPGGLDRFFKKTSKSIGENERQILDPRNLRPDQVRAIQQWIDSNGYNKSQILFWPYVTGNKG